MFDVKLGCSELSLRSYLRHLPNKENVKLIKAWQQHHPEGSKNRGLLSLMRRHRWHLSEEKNSNLQRYLADYPMLKTLYEVKQKLIRYMLLKTMNEKRMEKTLPRFLDLLEQLHHSPLRALTNTLTSWLQPIIAMWRFTRNNGITEGFHNKMEMISRRAYGFRYFENYRIRVMTHCGWDGVINRVR